MTTGRDIRKERGQRDPDAIAELVSLRDAWFDQQIHLARLLHRIDVQRAFVFEMAQSVEMLAALKGFNGFHARDLVLLGYTLDACPEVEDLLRKMEITFPAASAIGEIYRAEWMAKDFATGIPAIADGDDWILWARIERHRDLQRRVRERITEIRDAQPGAEPGKATMARFGTAVSPETAEDLARCHELASQRAGEKLTRAQMLSALAATYLHDADPLEKVPPARRLPHTSERLDDRTVPADVAHEIHVRSAGFCEVGCCDRPIDAFCHIQSHAGGSAREVENLFGGCVGHHTSYDKGKLRFLASTEDGRPVFLAVENNEILKPKPRPHLVEGRSYPGWLLRAMGPSARRKLQRKQAWIDAEAAKKAEAGVLKKQDGTSGTRGLPGCSGSTDGSGAVRERPRPPPFAGRVRVRMPAAAPKAVLDYVRGLSPSS